MFFYLTEHQLTRASRTCRAIVLRWERKRTHSAEPNERASAGHCVQLLSLSSTARTFYV